MKKYTIIAIAFFVGIVSFVPVFASAGSINLLPSTGTFTVGKFYTVGVFVNPDGETAYTSKIELSYPANLMIVQSFTPAGNVTTLTQPGYDLTDNVNGKLIKTVGFSSGITGNTQMGTITFIIRQAGVANVAISSTNSQLLDKNNKNIATVFGKGTFTITGAQPIIAPGVNVNVGGTVNTSTQPNPTSSVNSNPINPNPALAGSVGTTTAFSGRWQVILPWALLILVLLALIFSRISKREGSTSV